MQQAAQIVADVSQTLHGNDPALQGGSAIDLLDAGPHSLQHSEGSEWRRVARAATGDVDTDDVRGLYPDEVGVLRRGTNILGHDVASAKGLDVAPERAEERLGLVRVRVTDDNGLPAPEVEAARGGLVGHPSRQAQYVNYGFVLAGVGIHPACAQSRAERGVVDGDDSSQPRRLVVAEHELFVAVLRQLFEYSQALSPFPSQRFFRTLFYYPSGSRDRDLESLVAVSTGLRRLCSSGSRTPVPPPPP